MSYKKYLRPMRYAATYLYPPQDTEEGT
jgi:hypothetical protein